MKDTHPLTADEAIQHINTHATDDSIACIRDDDHRDRFHVHFAEDLIRISSRVDFTNGPSHTRLPERADCGHVESQKRGPRRLPGEAF